MFEKVITLLSLSIIALLVVAYDSTTASATENDEVTTEQGHVETEEMPRHVDGAIQINEMTDEQNGILCAQLIKEFGQIQGDIQLRQGMCVVMGSFAAAFASDGGEAVQSCQSAYDECLMDDLIDDDDDFDEFCLSAEDRQCEATVAEFAECFSAMFEWGFGPIRNLSGMTCEEATSDGGSVRIQDALENMEALGGDDFPDIPACQALREKCPDLS